MKTFFLVTLLVGSIVGAAYGNTTLQEDCENGWDESDASDECSLVAISGFYDGQARIPKCSIDAVCPGMFRRDTRVDAIIDLEHMNELVNCYGTFKRNSCG